METLSHLDDETDRAAPRRAGDSVAQLHLVAGWNVFGTGSALEQSCGEDARVELFAEPNPAVEPPAGQSCHSDARPGTNLSRVGFCNAWPAVWCT